MAGKARKGFGTKKRTEIRQIESKRIPVREYSWFFRIGKNGNFMKKGDFL